MFAGQAGAIGFGDIHVNSYIGEPANALIDFSTDGAEEDVKVMLLPVADYEKLGMDYPYGAGLHFRVISDGHQAQIKVTSDRPINDPFLNLMVEVSTHADHISKNFTFLLDPIPESIYSKAYNTDSQAVSDASEVKPEPVKLATKKSKKRAAEIPKKKARLEKNLTESLKRITKQSSGDSYKAGQSQPKLSVSNNSEASASKDQIDAIDEELIAKKKTIDELNIQIGEMRAILKEIQDKKEAATQKPETLVPLIAAPDALPIAASVVTVALPVQQVNKDNSLFEQGIMAAFMLLGLMLSAAMLRHELWKSKMSSAVSERDMDSAEAALPHLKPSFLGGMFKSIEWGNWRKFQFGKPKRKIEDIAPKIPDVITGILKHPAKVRQRSDEKDIPAGLIPPEYDLIEEADIYLALGHDLHAERILFDALKINEKNIDTHLSLLGIFAKRKDLMQFDALATKSRKCATLEHNEKISLMRAGITDSLFD